MPISLLKPDELFAAASKKNQHFHSIYDLQQSLRLLSFFEELIQIDLFLWIIPIWVKCINLIALLLLPKDCFN